jgi:hypothetical protein
MLNVIKLNAVMLIVMAPTNQHARLQLDQEAYVGWPLSKTSEGGREGGRVREGKERKNDRKMAEREKREMDR